MSPCFCYPKLLHY